MILKMMAKMAGSRMPFCQVQRYSLVLKPLNIKSISGQISMAAKKSVVRLRKKYLTVLFGVKIDSVFLSSDMI